MPGDSGGYVFISYAREDRDYVTRLVAYLRANDVPVRYDEHATDGQRWRDETESTVEHSAAVLVVVSSAAEDSPWVDEEIRYARRRGVELLAIVLDGQPWPGLGDVPTRPVSGGAMPDALVLARARHLVSHRGTASPALTAPTRWQGPAQPVGMVDRPAPIQHAVDALLAPGGSPVIGLVGAGGFGKTVTARMVCARWDVSSAFPGGLLWLDLGPDRRHASLAEVVGTLCVQLGGAHPGPVGAVDAVRALSALLAARPAALVVLDDARHADQVDPFLHSDVGGTRFLVTTRAADLLPRDAVTVALGGLDREQAKTVLLADLPALPEPAVARLLEVTGGQALAVHTANAMLRRAGGAGEELAASLAADDVLAALQLLAEHQRGRTYELSIFPSGTDIDLQMLRLLWAGTGGLRCSQARDLVAQLTDLDVLHDVRADLGLARVHDLVRAGLAARCDEKSVHATFLDAVAAHYAIGDAGRTRAWWNLPSSASYLWRHVTYHLAAAGLSAELDGLLTDLRWTRAKLFGVGAASLDVDLSRSADPTVAALRRSLARELPMLGPVTPEHSYADVLAARLGADPALAQVVAGLADEQSPEGRPRGQSVQAWPRITRIRPGWRLPDAPDPAARHVLSGHHGHVTGVAVSPDGTWLASAAYDKTVGLWDAASGHRRGTLAGHTDLVTGVAIARDGTWLASVGWDGTVRLWDVDSGKEQAALPHPGWVNAVAIAPDGTWLATATDDGTTRLWDTASGQQRGTLVGHIGSVTSVAASHDALWLATGGVDRTVRLWDTDGGEVTVLTGHTDVVTGVAIAPNGSWLASTSEDGTVRLWSADTGGFTVLKGHTDVVTAVAISPDSTWLATTSRDQTVRLWDAASGAERAVLAGHEGWVTGVAIAPDGTWLVSTGNDQTVRMWNAAAAPQGPTTVHSGPMCAIAAAADGRFIATGGADATVRLWDAVAGNGIATVEGHEGAVSAVALAPDGHVLLTGGEDATVRLWDPASAQQRAVLTGHTRAVAGIAVAPDGAWFASVSADATVRLWDAAVGEHRATLTGHDGAVSGVAIAPDGGWLATAGADRSVRLWTVDSGRKLLGRRTMTGAHPGPVLAGHADAVTAVAIAPDGAWLASVGLDRAVRLWDASGSERDILRGHDDAVLAVAISPDGRRLVTGGRDRTLRLWDSVSGVNIATMRVAGPLRALCWAPDGRSVFAAGQYGPYRFDIG